MLYNEESAPKIHAMIDINDQNEVVEESIAEWCPKIGSLRIESAEIDPNIPDQLSAAEALTFKSDQVDFRPHLHDKATKAW